MRQSLTAGGYTWLLRGYSLFFGCAALLVIVNLVVHSREFGWPATLSMSCCVALIAGVIALICWRFSRVWLDDEVLEIRRGRTLVRVPITDLTMVELVRSRPNYIRLRFQHRAPVNFVPDDEGYFSGGGEATRRQLYDLMRKGRRQ